MVARRVRAPAAWPPAPRRAAASRPSPKRRQVADHEHLGVAGQGEVRLTSTRPARSSGTPSVLPQRRGGDAGGPQHVARADRARRPPRRPSALDRRSRPRRSAPPRPGARARAARWPRGPRGSAASTRGPPSTSRTRACAGSMRRKSRTSAWRAISAIAPASSTPVGPAADDHEGQQRAALGRVGLAARPPRRRAGRGGGSRARPRAS